MQDRIIEPCGERAQSQRLLPKFFYSYRSLFLTWVLPQAFLLCSSLFFFWLLKDEFKPEKYSNLAIVGVIQSFTLLWGIFLAAFRSRTKLSVQAAFGFLCYFLVYFFINGWMVMEAMPFTSDWIANPFMMMLSQTTPIMIPGIFFAIRLAAFESSSTRSKNIAVSAIVAVCTVASFYLSTLLMGVFSGIISYDSPFAAIFPIMFFIFIMVVTSLFAVFSIRLVILVYDYVSKEKPSWQTPIYFFLGLLFPLIAVLCAFYFTKTLSFDILMRSLANDFLSATILTVINGFLLLVPLSKINGNSKKLLLFATSALFTFVFYMAFITVPLIPVAMFMIIAGVGLLMIMPQVLFFLAVKRMSEICRSIKDRSKYAIIAAGVCVLPFWIAGESFYVRTQINSALDYVENPDTSTPRKFKGNTASAVKALSWISAYKNDLFIPYITPLRMNILTNGMVLQDSKIDKMYLMLSGEKKEKEKKRGGRNAHGTNFAQSGSEYVRFDTQITDTKPEKTDSPEIFKYSITLKNTGSSRPEAGCKLTPSEGVFVCGMSMEVNGKEKEASFIEKRAALWAYENITKERLDPSIIYYTNLDDMILRVSPLWSGQSKRITLSFLTPPNFKGSKVEYMAVSKKDPQSGALVFESKQSANLIAATSEDASYLLVNNDGNTWPTFEREPYWALIADLSKNEEIVWTKESVEEKVLNALNALYAANPKIKNAHVYGSSLNFGLIYYANNENGTWTLSENEPFKHIMNKGGFDYDLSYLFLMADYATHFKSSKGETERLLNFPLPVFLSDSDAPFNPTDAFNAFVPELTEVRALKITGDNRVSAMRENEVIHFSMPPFANNRKVSVFSSNTQFGIAPVGISAITFRYPIDAKSLSFLSEDKHNYLSCDGPEIAPSNSPWAKAALLRHKSILMKRNPSLLDANLKSIAAASKEQRIVTPVTSAIIVETTTQEKAMKLAEAQALNSKSALAFEEQDSQTNMSEPPLWFYMLVAPLMLMFKRVRQFLSPKKDARHSA